jgi:hypothetical protein
MTDPGRAKAGANALKEIAGIGKQVGKSELEINPKGVAVQAQTKLDPMGIPVPVAGSGLLRIFMYTLAGILLICIILLIIDKWFYPVFKRDPGSPGFVMLPGTDTSEQFWTNLKDATKNIKIGSLTDAELQLTTVPLNTTLLEDKLSYAITMDVLINTKDLINTSKLMDSSVSLQNAFFMIAPNPGSGDKVNISLASNGGSITLPPGIVLRIEFNYNDNEINMNIYKTGSMVQTIKIKNIPHYTPFRIGMVKTPYTAEGYFNGRLIHTLKLDSTTLTPGTSGQNYIIAPTNIILTKNGENIGLSKGIQVMNLRIFSDTVTQSEMLARMSDLTDITKFNTNTAK